MLCEGYLASGKIPAGMTKIGRAANSVRAYDPCGMTKDWASSFVFPCFNLIALLYDYCVNGLRG
jgi:hypothetical protein